MVDTTSFSVIDQINVGSGPVRGLAISRDGAKLYVANYFANSVSVLRI